MTLSHRSWGEPAAEALVLLHGMWGGSRHWEEAGPALARGRFVAAPDLPGFGAEPHRDYSPAFFAGEVLAWMDALGIPRAALVGNSLGGRVAVAVAEAAPARVSGVVLVAPAGLTAPSGWLRALPKFRMPYEDGPDTIRPDVFRELAMGQIFSRPLDDPRVAPLAARERLALRGVSLAAFLQGSARCLTEMARQVPAAARLKPLPVRGLVWGRGDRLIPLAVAEELKALWPAARLEVIEDSGHVPHLETPGAFAEAVRATGV